MLGPINFIRHGTTMTLPSDRFFYKKVGVHPPKKGEWYLSGAIVEAYQAPNDLTTPYTIVKKVARAVRHTTEIPMPLLDTK
jgi:hypothetical protein